MKVTQGHYDALNKVITETMDSYGVEKIVEAYETGNFPRADKVKDLQKRLCFDLLHCSNVGGLVEEIYAYADNTHIYTALKRICPKVERKY